MRISCTHCPGIDVVLRAIEVIKAESHRGRCPSCGRVFYRMRDGRVIDEQYRNEDQRADRLMEKEVMP